MPGTLLTVGAGRGGAGHTLERLRVWWGGWAGFELRLHLSKTSTVSVDGPCSPPQPLHRQPLLGVTAGLPHCCSGITSTYCPCGHQTMPAQ